MENENITDLTVSEPKAMEVSRDNPLPATVIKARVQLIQEVMQAVMKDNEHYGVIPGCGKKPTLLKAGAEKLLSTFQIAPEFSVEELSTLDAIRYRVSARGLSASGNFLGEGVGECSTLEEKYKWKKAFSELEFNSYPEDRRRTKYGQYGATMQVRTEPADLANTVLKMAKKRALVDMTLTVTAASDIFTQDLEDIDVERKPETDEEKKTQPKTQGNSEQKADIPIETPEKTAPNVEDSPINVDESDKQFFVRFADAQKWEYQAIIDLLKNEFKVSAVLDLTRDQFESALEILKAGPDKWKEVNAK